LQNSTCERSADVVLVKKEFEDIWGTIRNPRRGDYMIGACKMGGT
jgi:hypothetical protein